MRNLLQVSQGIIIALVSIALLFGAFSLSLVEGRLPTATLTAPANATLAASNTPIPMPTLTPFLTVQPSTPGEVSPTPSPTPSATPSSTASPIPSPTASYTPSSTATSTQTPSLTATFTLPLPTTYCPMPLGWVPYIVQPDDTLSTLATYYQTNGTTIQQANCLPGTEVIPGTLIYVPFVPTQVIVTCGPPNSWTVHVIQPGDTLYHLGLIYGVSVSDLQRANCLGNSTLIRVGKNLYVPFGMVLDPPLLPSLTPTLTSMPTLTSTNTLLPSASDTPVGFHSGTEI